MGNGSVTGGAEVQEKHPYSICLGALSGTELTKEQQRSADDKETDVHTGVQG